MEHFQPCSVETRSLPGIVITRLYRVTFLPWIHRVNMAGALRARAVVSFVLSDVLEEDVVKNESEGKLEELAALFLENERKPAVRIRGYVEQVVANL